VSHKHLGDGDRDAAVIRALSRLPSYSPGPDFSDRVMLRVRLPEPKSVALMSRAVQWAREPRRAFVLAGAYAVSAAAALVLLVPWLFQNITALQLGLDWAGGRLLAFVSQGTQAAASWTVSSGLAEWFSSLSLDGMRLAFVLAGVTAAYAGCATMLRFLLRAPRGAHATVQA